MADLPFCVDCRYYEKSGMCLHPATDLVTGEKSQSFMPAYDQRHHEGAGYCGAAGNFWEAPGDVGKPPARDEH